MSTESMTSYVPLRRQLNVSREYEPGEQFRADRVHVVHPGMPPMARGAGRLPSIFDWLEMLEVAGHRALVFKDLPTPAGDRGWHDYPQGKRADYGPGITGSHCQTRRRWVELICTTT